MKPKTHIDIYNMDNRLPDDVLSTMRHIADTDAMPKPRISERLFKDKYLPIFLDTSGHADVSRWLDVAFTVYNEVDVYAEGKWVFRVPALVNTMPTYTKFDSKQSTSQIVNEANLHAARMPITGVTYLIRAMDSKITPLSIDMEGVRMWNEIMNYYGLKRIPLPDTLSSQTRLSTSIEDEFDDFEPL